MRAIDGDALIEFVENSYDITWHHDYEGGIKDACIEIINEIGRMPTIEPQRTGKWINCDGSEHWKCDKCGYRAGYWFNEENSSSWELDMSEWLSDFCPNCGAKME